MTEIERCPSGIPGLDKLLNGGFPRGRTILVSGNCGTGKTILATQFVYNGAAKYGEPGIIVILEQDPNEFKKDMGVFNFDIQKFEKEGKLIVVNASLSSIELQDFFNTREAVPKSSFSLLPGEDKLDKITDIIIKAAEKIGAKRVSIDSIAALDFMLEDKTKVRKTLLNMNYRLKKAGLTTIIVADATRGVSTQGIEEFIMDGVITLHYETTGADIGRHMVIGKMRSTAHSENIHTIRFVKGKGIEITDLDEPGMGI